MTSEAGGRRAKKLLIAVHRYLGAGLCLLFAVWFASGIVMVFVGFPHLDEDRRLHALPELGGGGSASPNQPAAPPAWPSPAQAFAGRAIDGQISLGWLGTRAAYRLVERVADHPSRARLVDARDATLDVVPTSDELARRAAAYLHAAGARRPAALAETLPETLAARELDRSDQWTPQIPAGRFPLRRFDAGETTGDQIYVSHRTAEVVQATTRHARLWAWLGAIPHWLYPIALRRHAETWRQLVLTLAGCGVLLSLSGLVIGIWQWRWRHSRWRWRWRSRAQRSRGPDGDPRTTSPYRTRWLRWHHQVGLALGCLVFTWVGSGALSLTPFDWSRGSHPSREEERIFSGGPLQMNRFVLPPGLALAACQRTLRPRELELIQVGGHPYYLCRRSSCDSRLVAADRADEAGVSAVAAADMLSRDAVLAAAAPLWAGRAVIDASDISIARGGDGYFQADDVQTGSNAGPAPDDDSILRVRVGGTTRAQPPGRPSDPTERAVWYYFDRRTGKLVSRLDPGARLQRWLYRGFHRLDFPIPYASLRRHAALWYLAIVALCTLGLFFSLTGAAITWGWLQRARRCRRPPAG